jgi:threonine aldolase
MNTKISENEKRALFQKCERFLNGHYPLSVKAQLAQVATQVSSEEIGDFYGKGVLIEDFERDIAELLGKPSVVFMPSGTMAQLIAIRIWCERVNNSKFAMHPTSHLELHEQEAYRHLHQLTAVFLGEVDRGLTLHDFELATSDIAAALVELPQRELGGVLPTWSELQQISSHCRERGLRLHLDGARLWETAPYYQKSYSEICESFDSVYVPFYKGLGGIAGAALAGPNDFIEEARVWQRRYGGNLVRLYPYVVSARDSLKQRLPKMSSYHRKAVDIAAALSRVIGIQIVPREPVTNMMHVIFNKPADVIESAFLKIAREQRIAGFLRVTPIQALDGGKDIVSQRCKAELSVGDATLDLATEEIVALFEAVMT